MSAVGDSISDRLERGLMLYPISSDWIRTVRDGSGTVHGLLPAHHGVLHDSSETACNCEPLSAIITCYLAVLRMTSFIPRHQLLWFRIQILLQSEQDA